MNSPSERQMGLRPDLDIVQSAEQNARRLEQKAMSCIKIAEQILPGAKSASWPTRPFAVEEMAALQ